MKDLFGAVQYSGLIKMVSLSPCEKYRYWLKRTWEQGGNGKTVCFIMLNPSTADAVIDDPTIRRCITFTKAWGYSTLKVCNLFAYRATDPKELLEVDNPVGPDNDLHLIKSTAVGLVVAAWGMNVPFDRDNKVMELLEDTKLYCLGTTSKGHPRHPLYVKGDQLPIEYRGLP